MASDNFSVLICDDSILARKQLSDAVTSVDSGIIIYEAKNGQECIDTYVSSHPTLVFIDIVMPVLDGIGAIKGVLDKDSDAKIIVVSSVGTKNELKKAIEAGAVDFIQKPFSAPQIKEIIEYYDK